jgi:hypothetical protein
MRNAGVLAGFAPMIVYGVLAGSTVPGAVLAPGAAVVVTLITGIADLRKGRILAWANLLLFGSLLIALGLAGLTGILPFTGMLMYAALAAVAFGSILAKAPFTLQYARDMVDRALWENPLFIRVNNLMTGTWGAVFAINLVISYLAFAYPHATAGIALPLTYLVLIAGIIFTLWYPGHIRKKHAPASGQSGI